MGVNIKIAKYFRLFLLIVAFLVYKEISSQTNDAQYYFYYEQYYGSISNTENTVSVNHLWRSLDHNIIPSKIFKEKKNIGILGNWSYRAAKLALLDYPIAYYLQVYNHENGHRFRALEMGCTDIKITIALPPPIEFGPSFTSFYCKKHSQYQELLMRAGGVEASNILSNTFVRNMWLDNELDYHSAFFYFAPANDLNFYILGGYEQENSDIRIYQQGINALYTDPLSSKIEEQLSHEQLKKYAIASIVLNPYNINSAWSLIEYVFFAKSSSELFSIPITEQIKYIPRFHFTLTPYGPELILQNHIKYKDKLFALHFSHSDGTFENSWRIDLKSWNWKPTKRWSFAGNIQVWEQPKVNFYVNEELQEFEGLGGLFTITSNYNFISKESRFGMSMQMGYKTAGFAEGEQLDHSLILRGGLSFRFAKE